MVASYSKATGEGCVIRLSKSILPSVLCSVVFSVQGAFAQQYQSQDVQLLKSLGGTPQTIHGNVILRFDHGTRVEIRGKVITAVDSDGTQYVADLENHALSVRKANEKAYSWHAPDDESAKPSLAEETIDVSSSSSEAMR